MRGRFAILALLALTLPACGSASSDKNSSKPVSGGQQVAAGVDNAASPVQKAQAKATKAKAQALAKTRAKELSNARAAVAAGSYVAPAIRVKTSTGKAPAVVILPDTGDKTNAAGEAKKLSKLGIGALVVQGPASAPRNVAAFETAVAEVQVAVAALKKRDGIDPHRIGIIGEGVGAHVGAVVAGRDPGSILAAALADIGGVVVPSKDYAPERWVKRAAGTRILFQKDLGARGMNLEEIRRLMLAAPPATLMQQYNKLGSAAQAARDRWLRGQLVAG